MSRPRAPGSKSHKGNPHYFPLDEALARPRIKALRALRFFDWCAYDDLMVACDVGDSKEARGAFLSGIHYAIDKGEIEKDGAQPWQHYRITAKGRAALADLHAAYERNMRRAA